MRKVCKLLAAAAALGALLPVQASAALYVTIVQGLGGMPEYDSRFTEQREQVLAASESMTGEDKITVLSGKEATRDALLDHFAETAEKMTEEDRLLIYLIGHGSFDDEQHKFNIPGPDITTEDLRRVLDELPGSNHLVVSTASTSGSLLEPLEDDSRVVVTATRSGSERNATEFGAFFAEALASEEADTNKNGSISVQEAFDYANRHVEDFFESSGKLATEHPQLRGEAAPRLNIARLMAPTPAEADDPEIVQLLQRREEIDAEIEELQLNRNNYSSAEYTQRLRDLVLESATVTEQIQTLGEEGEGEQP